MAISTLVAKATITVNAPIARVWDALVNPEIIKKYMFNTNVISKWTVGSSITWSGIWQGRKFEDKGVILRLEPRRLMQYTHFSPLSGLPDVPENYHTVTIELSRDGKQTRVSLMQDHNPTEEEREYSQANWKMMLEALKKVVEQ